MTDPIVAPSNTQATAPRNPFEIALGLGAVVAIVVGIIVGGAASSAAQDGLSGMLEPGALAWAGLGTQLWQLGVLVLVGLLFYWMVRWDRDKA